MTIEQRYARAVVDLHYGVAARQEWSLANRWRLFGAFVQAPHIARETLDKIAAVNGWETR